MGGHLGVAPPREFMGLGLRRERMLGRQGLGARIRKKQDEGRGLDQTGQAFPALTGRP